MSSKVLSQPLPYMKQSIGEWSKHPMHSHFTDKETERRELKPRTAPNQLFMAPRFFIGLTVFF
jgi:hypothetical protein